MRRALALAAAAVQIVLTLACSSPPPLERTAPLSTTARTVEAVWPAGCEPVEWRARPSEDVLPDLPAAPQALRRLRLGAEWERDERVAFLAPAGSSYRFGLEVPRDVDLRAAVGRLSQGESGPPLTLAARVHPQRGEAVTVFEKELAFGDPEVWSEIAIDLGRWSGESIVLELAATGAEAPDRCGETLGGWATPRLVPRKRAADSRPNVIWISVDTLRADRLGCYGNSRATSPELDRLAAMGVRFDWAISQAPWTRPSHRSMLTGLYPISRAELESPFLGSLLHGAGYRTIALTGAGQMDSRFGFDRGFEIYQVNDWIHEPEPMVDWVTKLADAPFFLFLHTYETHEPYTHDLFAKALPSGRLPGEFSKKFFNQLRGALTDEEKRYAEALYDGDIAYTDGRLGRLFRDLESRGLLESTLLIVTSDHGEQFWDHGTWGHGQSLHDHQIRVPLILSLPKAPGFRVGRVESDQVELLDLYPTVLDLAGVALEHEVQGRTLRPLLEGRGPLPPKQAFAESTNIRSYEKRALRTPRYKFVLWEKRKVEGDRVERYELYDLRADPLEQHDLFGKHPEQAARLQAEVERRVQGADTVRDEEVPAGIDAELRKQLEALGYIGN